MQRSVGEHDVVGIRPLPRTDVTELEGDLIAYVRGPGTWYRKGYHGSSNDDIWISKADGSSNRRITIHKGQDSYPMWSGDGKTLYYVSDVAGGLAHHPRSHLSRMQGMIERLFQACLSLDALPLAIGVTP